MKVAFDEHVPVALAKVFIALASEKPIQKSCHGLIFEKARDYAPKANQKDYIKNSDVPWLDRFAEANGHAVISGDVKMRKKVHEKLALYHHGFVVIFFEPQWGNWNFYRRSSLMLHWWQEITQKIRSADKGTFWVVPSSYPPDGGELRNVSLGLARLLKDNPKRIPRNQRRRKKKVADDNKDRQNNLQLGDETVPVPSAHKDEAMLKSKPATAT